MFDVGFSFTKKTFADVPMSHFQKQCRDTEKGVVQIYKYKYIGTKTYKMLYIETLLKLSLELQCEKVTSRIRHMMVTL